MGCEVVLTAGAERDLVSIHDHLADTEGEEAADRLLQRLVKRTTQLTELPERGSHPRELLALGIREYRQLILEPYRVIYRLLDGRIYIMLIVDGRRDMQSLLARRLLGAE